MVLHFSSPPELYFCAVKRFLPDELHCTRISRHSVLILMLDGLLRFREAGIDFELRKGEYYIQQAGLFQQGVHLGESPVYFFIEFQGTFTEGNAGLPLRGHFSQKSLLPILERLESGFRDRNTDLFRLNSYMLRIFSELLSSNPVHDERTNVAYRLKNYLNTEYTDSVRLSDLSHMFGYTQDYLIRIFKEQFGITPHRYLIERRMDHARWLLENTKLSTEQVASAVGYGDFSSFYRSFCETYHSSPGAFKKASKSVPSSTPAAEKEP